MDIATVIRKVQRTFGDSSNIFIIDNDIIDWINDAQSQIARETKCLTTQVTVNASSGFPWTYPANFMRALRVVYGTTPLYVTEIEDLDYKQQDLTSKSFVPCFYYHVSNSLVLFPVAQTTDATVVTIQYASNPAIIATNADLLTVPVHFHEDIVRFCVARAHERNENYKGMEVALNEFTARMGSRIEDIANPEDTYTVVCDDPADSWY